MPAPMPVTLRLDHNEIHQRFSGYLTSAVSTLENEIDGLAGGNRRTGKRSLGLR